MLTSTFQSYKTPVHIRCEDCTQSRSFPSLQNLQRGRQLFCNTLSPAESIIFGARRRRDYLAATSQTPNVREDQSIRGTCTCRFNNRMDIKFRGQCLSFLIAEGRKKMGKLNRSFTSNQTRKVLDATWPECYNACISGPIKGNVAIRRHLPH